MIFVIDPMQEHIAVSEARKLGIPVVAVVDTNCNPELIDYPIPGNDDAIRAISLFAGVISSAIIDGQNEAGKETLAKHESTSEIAEEVYDIVILKLLKLLLNSMVFLTKTTKINKK